MSNHKKPSTNKNIHASLLDLYSYLKLDKIGAVRI